MFRRFSLIALLVASATVSPALRVLPPFAMTAAMMVMSVGSASAQAVATTTSGAPFSAGGVFDAAMPYVLAATSAAMLFVIGIVGAMTRKWFGITIDKEMQDSLHKAAMTGVAAALDRLGVKAHELTIDLKATVLAQAAEWVVDSVPDALARLGVTPEMINTLVSSKLALLAHSVTETAVAAPTAGDA